ncbi:hypothetical protein PF007_g21540 [Phytophthora fragariae]|uniref:Transposase Tc1-like domain-containing protein n=1 Tax=Phytophthora fragariae TaxID=53985 RepID=A0A6A3SHU3_9STRA|nr:hypothetical protein PF003_g13328 [Phytophthora fragariae]KAE9084385.1 hypothetical protein PF007_g21540 [Phytophthora fragariae]KAE9116511.1 hypothetical protein PF006_g19022 [Phytophthora fragariae]KAE9274632.1 hypothetical protein PF001_g26973 [Phytophthora fragariae]
MAERGPLQDSANPSPRPGRRPALTEREVRLLVLKAAEGDRFAAELKTELGLKAFVRTVQRLLQRAVHLGGHQMVYTLPLTAAHKAARMEWAEEHILNPGTVSKLFYLLLRDANGCYM